MSSSDRALINAFRSISNMCDRINLPKTITDRANTLFKMVHDGRNLKGRANEAIASACLYIACRQEGVPRTFKEIVAVSTVSKKVKDLPFHRSFRLRFNINRFSSTNHRQNHVFQNYCYRKLVGVLS